MQANINGVGTGGVLINENGEILLLQRVKPPEAGCWSIPGGAIEFGETAKETVIREFHEETDLTCDVVDFLGYYDYILQKEGRHWVSLFFVMEKISQNAPENKEPKKHTDLQWFDMDNLPDKLTVNTANAIKLYKKWIKKNCQQ